MFTTKYNKEKKLWSGNELPPLYNPKISAAQALFNAMTVFGPKVAQVTDHDGISLTYDDIRIRAIRAAQNLQARGFKPKQTFVIFAENLENLAPITFATFAIGCTLNSLSPFYENSELIRMMNMTKPVVVFCDISCYDTINECLVEMKSEAKIFTFGGSCGQSEPVENLLQETHKEEQFVPVTVDGEMETAVIIHSCGTTGAAKALCLSHAALLDAALRVNINNFSEITLTFSPIFRLNGLRMLMMGTLCGATRIITTEKFSPERQLHLIEKYKVSVILNASYQINLTLKNERFCKTDLSSLKFVIVGGSKVPLYLKTQANCLIPHCKVLVAYGTSETASISVDWPASSVKDTIGKLANGIRVKITDDNGNRCDANVEGEICVKTNYRFLGYLNNQEATDALFDSDGFIKTGDIGFFDDDGDLYIIDRKKDLLKYCQVHMSPSEMEAYLMQSPLIQAACVVGVPDGMGDLPAAAIVRNEGSNITEEEVYNLIANHFSDAHKLRGGVYFMDSFPTLPNGKVKRSEIVKTAREQYSGCEARCHQRFI